MEKIVSYSIDDRDLDVFNSIISDLDKILEISDKDTDKRINQYAKNIRIRFVYIIPEELRKVINV